MSGTEVYRWDELPADTGSAAVRREIPGAGASLKQIEIPAGTRADRHSHSHEQFVVVLEGSGTLESEAGSVELRPGTVIHFAPNAWHSAVFATRTVLVEVNLAPQPA